MRFSDWTQRIDLGKEIQEVYVHSLLFKLGVRLVSIFLPLYLLDLGFAPLDVVTFFSVYYGMFLIGSLPNVTLATKIGYKRTCLLSSPLILAFYLLLRGFESGGPEVFAAAVVGGLGFNMYWIGMNPEVATSSHDKSREKETGYFFSMSSLASVISPFLGGVLLAGFSFPLLFLVTAGLVTSSFLPFLFSSEHRTGMDMQPLEFLRDVDRIDIQTFLIQGGVDLGRKILWPLYLATIIGSVGIGSAGSLLALGSAIVSALIGKITDDENRSQVMSVGGLVGAASFFAMSQVTSVIPALIVSTINGLGMTAESLPIFSKAMDHSEREDKAEYFAFREIFLAISRLLILSVIALLFIKLPSREAYLGGFTLFSGGILLATYLGSEMRN